MPNPSPPVDARSAADFLRDLNESLTRSIPGWPERAAERGAVPAVMAIFARYCEIVAERLNRAPERKMLAFLELLGAQQLPPQAARVPITFQLAAKAVEDVLVTEGTQVAAAPAPGESPVIYETEHNLKATVVRLDQLWVKEPLRDRYADRRGLLDETADPALPFVGDTAAAHALYIGHSTFFGVQPLQRLAMQFDFGPSLSARRPQSVVWELWDGANRIALAPDSDATAGFTRTGAVVFQGIPRAAVAEVEGHCSHWLVCRSTGAFAGPLIFGSVTLARRIEGPARIPAAALSNATPIDLTKDFLPLGEKPKFGTTFYVAADPEFSIRGMAVTLRIELLNPAGATTPVAAASASGNAQIAWEFWNGEAWLLLGSGQSGQDVQDPATGFSDTTRALTQTGQVRFLLPSAAQVLNLGGVKSAWFRARLAGGDYGEEAAYALKTPPGQHPEYLLQPATLSPPWIHSLTIAYQLEDTAEIPELLYSENDFRLRKALPQRAAFETFEEPGAALYFGMKLPGSVQNVAQPMGVRPLRFYFLLCESVRSTARYDASQRISAIRWEYWNGSDWRVLDAQDLTASFTRSGPVLFLSPSDWRPNAEFALERYWVRALLTGSLDPMPVRRVLTNTVDARQSVAIQNEMLGSSNGGPNQVFHTCRRPVLDGPRLEVKERQSWTAWDAVPDFYASTPESRHYAIDPLTGAIGFGDGINGRIPPTGSNNIRIGYRTGGGPEGNKTAGTIVQLKTTLPSVEKAINWRDAEGGAAVESMDSLVERAPSALRHRNRAVAAQDFEDLARLATPEVALAKCVPLRDLANDPDGSRLSPGTVSVIIVPFSRQHRPLPSYELIERVRAYLSARKADGIELVVVGPEYVAGEIQAKAVLSSPERVSEIDAAIRNTLADFLDPVYGGPDQTGWTFGRRPHRSDLFSLIHAIDGVDHVASLALSLIPDRPGVEATGRFLVCPGPIHVQYT
jgi:Baseplate J-like protein